MPASPPMYDGANSANSNASSGMVLMPGVAIAPAKTQPFTTLDVFDSTNSQSDDSSSNSRPQGSSKKAESAWKTNSEGEVERQKKRKAKLFSHTQSKLRTALIFCMVCFPSRAERCPPHPFSGRKRNSRACLPSEELFLAGRNIEAERDVTHRQGGEHLLAECFESKERGVEPHTKPGIPLCPARGRVDRLSIHEAEGGGV